MQLHDSGVHRRYRPDLWDHTGCLHYLFLFTSEDLVLLSSQLVLFFSHEIWTIETGEQSPSTKWKAKKSSLNVTSVDQPRSKPKGTSDTACLIVRFVQGWIQGVLPQLVSPTRPRIDARLESQSKRIYYLKLHPWLLKHGGSLLTHKLRHKSYSSLQSCSMSLDRCTITSGRRGSSRSTICAGARRRTGWRRPAGWTWRGTGSSAKARRSTSGEPEKKKQQAKMMMSPGTSSGSTVR